MKQQESVRARAWAMAALMVLGLAGWAGAAEPGGGGGQAEGIKVHGHWTIEVKNQDGTLASRHEVENELYTGNILLAGQLGRLYSNPTWRIRMIDQVGRTEWGPCGGAGHEQPCLIGEPSDQGAQSNNLSVLVPLSGGVAAGTVELSGSITATDTKPINVVESHFIVASLPYPLVFTKKYLAQLIPVQAGQVIQVKVVFSFS